jgi:hypothetical protein
MARSTRSYHEEAEQLRARGHTYQQIAHQWRLLYGFNSRVAYRLSHGLTQRDVADLWNEQWPDAELPKTAKSISYWETWPRSGRAPSVDTLNKLAFLYQCSAGELLDGADVLGQVLGGQQPGPEPGPVGVRGEIRSTR